MSLSVQLAADLTRGPVYSFWPNPSVPMFGAGVYTIWHRDGRFIYVGSLDEELLPKQHAGIRPKGFTRAFKATPAVAAAAISSVFTWPTA